MLPLSLQNKYPSLPVFRIPSFLLKFLLKLLNSISIPILCQETIFLRMSCNGCRVLRKGCSQDCVLRPSIQWINSSESQANATIFLAKFYGRAGLINLINAGPTHLRHVIFGSLLYEACGRIINPVHGSVGLMSSGNWPQCQAAVEAVLQGRPLAMQVSGDDDSSSAATDGHSIMPLKSCDIRHLSKDSAAALHRVKTPHRFKRSAKKRVDSVATEFMNELESKFTITGWDSFEDNKNFDDHQLNRAPSHDSFSVETVEQALINRDELVRGVKPAPSCPGNGDQNDIELELTLGLSQVGHPYLSTVIDISNGES